MINYNQAYASYLRPTEILNARVMKFTRELRLLDRSLQVFGLRSTVLEAELRRAWETQARFFFRGPKPKPRDPKPEDAGDAAALSFPHARGRRSTHRPDRISRQRPDRRRRARHRGRGAARRHRSPGGDRRPLRRGGARRQDRPARAHHRPAAALLRGEDVPRPVPGGGRPHRCALRLVPVAADRLAVRSRLHPDGAGALPGGDRSGRLPGSDAALPAVLQRAGGRGARRTSTVAGERYVQAALARDAGGGSRRCRRASRWRWRFPAAWTARRRGCWRAARREDLGRDPDLVRAFTLDFGGGADAAQARGRGRRALAWSAPGSAWRWPRRSTTCARRSSPSRTTIRSTWNALPRRCACCAHCGSATRACAI